MGQAFRWGPDQINTLAWSMRKRLIDDHRQAMKELESRSKSK